MRLVYWVKRAQLCSRPVDVFKNHFAGVDVDGFAAFLFVRHLIDSFGLGKKLR